ERDEQDVAHDVRARDQERGGRDGRERRDQRMRAEPAREREGPERGGDRREKKGEMQGDLAPSRNPRGERDEERPEGGVLRDLPHGLLRAVPVDAEAVEVEGVRPDLLRG